MDNYFLDLHKALAQGKAGGFNGLCSVGIEDDRHYSDVFADFIPNSVERARLVNNGFCPVYWASGLPDLTDGESYLYTPLRQTILLFCHEILNRP